MKQAASHLLISELRSTGDNFRFREELVGLARRLLDEVRDGECPIQDRR
jgi:hypothetical protein